MSAIKFAQTADGTEIAYRVRGSGPDFVFARGWVTHLELVDEDPSVRAFFSRLERNFRVISYDGRGNGLSTREVPDEVSVHDLVDDLRAVVDATCDGEFVLWGSSWAGPAAVVYAAEHPDRVAKLILDGTFAQGATLTSPARAAAFLALLETARFQPEAVYASMSYLTDPEPGLTHTARVERTRRSIDPGALLALHRLLYEIDVSAHLELVGVPTLVLHRERSKAVPVQCARDLAQKIPDAQLVELHGRDHNLWSGDTPAVWRAVADFLDCAALNRDPSGALAATDTSIVFVDQVGSTAQMRLLGDERGVEVQAQMIEMLAHLAKPFEATPYSDTGDGIVFLLDSAADSVAMAQVIQRRVAQYNAFAPEDEQISLRIGVHTGTIRTSTSGRQSGLSIAVASRLCDEAGPDGIVVSDATKLECEVVTGDREFEPAGRIQLKGIGALECFRCSW